MKYWGYYPVAGKFLFVPIIQFFVFIVASLYILYKELKVSNINPIKKEQVKYFIFAFSLLIFMSFDYLPMFYFVNIYPFGYVFALLFCVIVYFCIFNANSISFNLFFLQSVILISLYFFILTVPFILGKQTGNWFLSAIVLVSISLVGPHIFNLLKNRIEKLMLSEQEAYQHFLLSTSKSMYKEKDINKLSCLIVRMLNKHINVKFSALFLYSKEKKCYSCIAKRGERINGLLKINEKDEIIDYIKSKAKPFILNINLFQKEKFLFDTIHKNISLIIPITNMEKLIAFIVMGHKNNGSLFSQKDLKTFTILSDEVYFAIENCNFLTKVNNQQCQLFEADKLAKIGQMADGFANQLKNRLNQFYLVGEGINYELNSFKNINDDFIRHNDTISVMLNYIGQMADSIIDDVKKTNDILQNILTFSKSGEHVVFSSLSLRQITELCLNLLKIKHKKEKIPLVLHLPNQDEIYGIKNQLQRILFNCLDNAYEAILEKQNYIKKSGIHIKDYKPNITIELKYIYKNAKIYIHDNGIGIKEENTNKIFSAFFTTKLSEEKNSGMGLYIAKKMITDNHKGTIQFKSKYGYGTTFLITLPAAV